MKTYRLNKQLHVREEIFIVKIILVQLADHQWTMPAVHLASALARTINAKIILLYLTQVPHLSYLGTPFGYTPPTPQQYAAIDEYAATAEDYGIEISLQIMQCITPLEALLDAAEQLQANAVFAYVPESRIPYWQRFQKWLLQRRVAKIHRQLFILDRPQHDTDRLPTIVVRQSYELAAPVKRGFSNR
jgi:hypothetical protein